MRPTTLIYSGGSDSYTLLHWLRYNGYDVKALSFDYNQRHSKELDFAIVECSRLGIPHAIIKIPFLFDITSTSALTFDADVPEGFYADENMKKTVVPNRNMILLSIATAYAINNQCDYVAYGAHAGDHDIYPDCRKEFVDALDKTISLCDWDPPSLIVPFLSQDKRGIYAWGLAHGLQYDRSWTCYKGGDKACGMCGSCVERLHAFHDLGAKDPIEYEDREFYLSVIPL